MPSQDNSGEEVRVIVTDMNGKLLKQASSYFWEKEILTKLDTCEVRDRDYIQPVYKPVKVWTKSNQPYDIGDKVAVLDKILDSDICSGKTSTKMRIRREHVTENPKIKLRSISEEMETVNWASEKKIQDLEERGSMGEVLEVRKYNLFDLIEAYEKNEGGK